MSSPLRKYYLKLTDLTNGLKNANDNQLNYFYKLWSIVYDVSIRLDPAYQRELNKMIDSIIWSGDITLDIGCGTGLASIPAANKAKLVVGIDPSSHMLNQLRKKMNKFNIQNIELRNGYFPDSIKVGECFNSILCSFMLVHFNQEERCNLVCKAYEYLDEGGRIGIFTARGEIAKAFETYEQVNDYLSGAGFRNIHIHDVADVYRIASGVKI